MALSNPVIVIPGITASSLRDEYELTPEVVWSAILNKDYRRITLHPSDLRYELEEPSRVTPDALLKLAYRELVMELRHDLASGPDEPVPVYPFAYDWRMPLDQTEARLAAFIDEVVERTKLMKHYDRAGYADDPRVDLVGHSMGGLIITGYLQKQGANAPVGKVATLGTPYRGSFEAPIKVATGTAVLGEDESSSREREAARLTPALYHLLPRYPGALKVDPGLPGDLYDTLAWQRGVHLTIGTFIHTHGLKKIKKAEREKHGRELLGEMLKTAGAHRDRVETFKLADAGLDAGRWLCIIGVNSRTRIALRIEQTGQGPEFDLSGGFRRDRWKDDDPAERVETGDGTVPYLGAKPTFLGVENLVCVRPADFGYWEIADRGMLKAAGFHAVLPQMNLIHRLIVSHFTGKPRKGTWGRPAPDIGKARWKPPIRKLTPKE